MKKKVQKSHQIQELKFEKAGSRSYEEIVKIIKSIKKEIEKSETSPLQNQNVRIL